jgi:hypothetical protein
MSDRREPGDQLPPQVAANQERTPEGAPAQGAADPTRSAVATAPANNQPTTQAGSTGASSNVGSTGTDPTVDPKARYGFWIVIAGLGSVIILYIGTIITFAILTTSDTLANNVVASMGAITGVIGSLVGAYFGVQLGASGKEASDAAAAQSSALAQGAMSQLDPGQTQDAIQAAERITSLPTGSPT